MSVSFLRQTPDSTCRLCVSVSSCTRLHCSGWDRSGTGIELTQGTTVSCRNEACVAAAILGCIRCLVTPFFKFRVTGTCSQPTQVNASAISPAYSAVGKDVTVCAEVHQRQQACVNNGKRSRREQGHAGDAPWVGPVLLSPKAVVAARALEVRWYSKRL